MDQNSVLDLINGNVYGIWYLVGAALVFFMQCGFAMVEAGFTRAKNAGNIIMKNLMDFCLGTVVFILIGFGILCGEDLAGIIGKPGFDIFSDYANFDWSSFVFNLVFCATAATIVSGAMAERTKFISYWYLFRSDFRCDLSGRNPLGMGRRLAVAAFHTVPRFRRFRCHPHGRRCFCTHRRSNPWSPYW